ncbi:hypothetical protein NDU88_004721 [Pleurodeles waltl]|uniref:Uncharacterized protein n=1 Tax=Pleurodeles waltl TaxID=8319 RepID=A0AAV7QGY4_PLEWA|nr:hypothetical protein NDU88_004721 [Pleurodeles waltl]
MFLGPGSTSVWVGDPRGPATSRRLSHRLRRIFGRQDGPLDLARGFARKSGTAQALSFHAPSASSAIACPQATARPQAADAGGRILSLGRRGMRPGLSTGPRAPSTAGSRHLLLRGAPVVTTAPWGSPTGLQYVAGAGFTQPTPALTHVGSW